MKDLIEALQILSKYADPNERNPTWCEHDRLNVAHIDPAIVSAVDKAELEHLGFGFDLDHFYSYRYGSY